MALTATYELIRAAMVEAFPTLQTGLGQRDLDEHAAYPRMVWVPARDAYAAPTRDRAQQRSLRTCDTVCEVHLWGEEIADVEGMRERLFTVLQAIAPGAWDSTAGEWTQPGTTTAGEKLVMLVSLKFSQHELPAPTTVTIATVAPDTTGAADPDGQLQVGETS